MRRVGAYDPYDHRYLYTTKLTDEPPYEKNYWEKLKVTDVVQVEDFRITLSYPLAKVVSRPDQE